MFIKEIFLQVIDYLKINEQVKLKQLNKRYYEIIKVKFADYGFMNFSKYYNEYPIFFTRYEKICKYIYNRYKIKKYYNPNKKICKYITAKYHMPVRKSKTNSSIFDGFFEEKIMLQRAFCINQVSEYTSYGGGIQITLRSKIYYTKWNKKEQDIYFDKWKSKNPYLPFKYEFMN